MFLSIYLRTLLIGCLAASRDELHIRKMKLNYQEVGQCSKDAQALWERKLTAPGRTTVQQDKKELYHALCQGDLCVCGFVCVCTFICLPVEMSSSVFPLYVQAFPRTDVGKFGCFFPISIGCVTGCPSAFMPQTHPTIICWSSWLHSNMRFWWI